MNLQSWYSLTSNRLLKTLGVLQGEINCDICVIGAGFTGLSAALELSQKGYSVIILETNGIISSASGKNGGHLLRGYIHSPRSLASKLDTASAKVMCDLTMEGLALVTDRINRHNIDCDLKFGHVTAAMNDDHTASLRQEIEEWEEMGYPNDLQYIGSDKIKTFVNGKDYIGGMYDRRSAHFHPLNYGLGIAQAAQDAGCKIYDETPALSIEHGTTAKIKTPHGLVHAKFVVLGGHVELKGVETLNRKVIAASANIIATEPLGEDRARSILPQNVAVSDANFIMNYFRLSHDNRLLFGGNCNYSGMDYPGQDQLLKKRMVKVFPSLADVKIDHCWSGPLDITLNRMPNFGRLAPNVFYAHGYCGHGVILSNMAGKLMAEVIGGTAERFDIFTQIKHAPFIGGDLLKRPLFVLGMMWFRLRDLL